MKKRISFYAVLVVFALSFVVGCATTPQTTAITTNQLLRVSNIVFKDNYRGPGSENKSEDGLYAAKYWKGQPQIMCYNSATRNDLPLTTLQAMLGHLSANRPQSAADMANENFARREFSINAASAPAAQTTTMAVQPATASTTMLTENEIVFNNNFADAKKPQSGYFAAKYWKGQPQIMCYNSATRNDLPLTTLQAMLGHLSANRPQVPADLANENFARREFSIGSVPTAAKIKTAVTTVTPSAQASPAPLADSNAELASLKAKLMALETAEIERQAKIAAADKKAKTTAAAKALEARYLEKLAKLGFEEGEKAVSKFQETAKIEADGKLGPQTRRMIDKSLAVQEDCAAKKIGGKNCETPAE